MGKFRKRFDIGHATFVLFITSFVIWYFIDAYSASSSIQNLILIAPASALALVLCAIVLFQIFSAPKSPAPEKVPEKGDEAGTETVDGWKRFRSPIFIVLFGLYILTMDVIGFDVATFLFVAAAMFLQGERRLWVIAGYSLGFGTLVILVFSMLLPYPMMTLVVPVP